MNGPTHKMLSVCAAFGVAQALDLGPVETVGLAGVAYKAPMLPDQLEGGILPHRGPTHRVWAVPLVAAAVLAAFAFGWRPLIEALYPGSESPFVGEVTQIDSIIDVFAVLTGKVARAGPIIAVLVALGVTVGYATHLLADMCTKAGLYVGGRKVWLLPASLRVRTGGTSERVFQLLLLCAVGAYVYLEWWPS